MLISHHLSCHWLNSAQDFFALSNVKRATEKDDNGMPSYDNYFDVLCNSHAWHRQVVHRRVTHDFF